MLEKYRDNIAIYCIISKYRENIAILKNNSIAHGCQGWAFYIAIYRECNILHHLEISRYYDIQKISRYFNDIFLCLILINFGLLWTWKQFQIIFLVVLLYMWAWIGKFLLLYLICYYICDKLSKFMTLKIWHFCRKKHKYTIFVVKS